MVECNAQGLYAFYTLLKNLSVWTVNVGKEWVVCLFQKMIDTIKKVREWFRRKFEEYFLKKDLSKDELQT